MELEDLSIVEKAAMLSGGSEWDSRGNDRADIPGFVMSDGPHGVRRQLGEGDHLASAHPSRPPASRPPAPWPTPGIGARRRDGRGARQGSSRSRRERVAWTGHEHQTQPAVRTQLRVLFGRSDRRRPYGRRPHSRHPEQRRLRMPEAFRGQQPGAAPPGQQLRGGRTYHARIVSDRF